jgi:hypothetical protein
MNPNGSRAIDCESAKPVAIHYVPYYLFGIAAFWIFLCNSRQINVYDEGIVLTGAMRVMAGQIIHRDFFSEYGPAQDYILAGLFKLFWPSVLIERVWDVAVKSTIAVVCFVIASRFGSRPLALAAYAMTTIWLAGLGFSGFSVFPALLFALVGTCQLVRFYQGDAGPVSIAFAGAATGLTTLFRYDMGFYTAVAQVLVGACYCVSTARGRANDGRPSAFAFVAYYAIGLAIPTLPVAIVYLAAGALTDFWFDVVTFQTRNYISTRSLPFPPLRGLHRETITNAGIYLPIVTWLAVLICSIPGARRPLTDNYCNRWSTAQLLFLSVLFYAKGLVRVSPIHMSASIVVSLILLWILPTFRPNKSATKGIVVATLLLAGICSVAPFLTATSQLFINLSVAWHTLNRLCSEPPWLLPAACFEVSLSEGETIQYVEDTTNVNNYILVGTTRHDKIFANNLAFYFLANRMPVTKWFEYIPGLQTTTYIQREMIAELELKRPPVIVLQSDWDDVREPNKSAESSHIVLLDDYIRDNYQEEKRFGTIAVLRRKSF